MRTPELEPVLVQRRDDLGELNALYPGIGLASSFDGLSWPCPDCTRELTLLPVPFHPELSARRCESCGGIWMDSEIRTRLAAPQQMPSEPAPRPAAESADERDDPVLTANAAYARNFQYGHMSREPRRKIAVLTCMDARMRLYEMLGMEAGDLNVIRNAGGIVTEDTLRSLILSHYLLGTREFYVINHTDCGMLHITDEEFRAKLVKETGASSAVPATFHPIRDLEENVREQLRRLRSHPWVPDSVRLRGFVYDVRSGALNEVTAG